MFSISDIEEIIDVDVEEWPGNCYAIATAIVESGLIDGRAVYGHWLGYVDPESMFYHKSKAGFCRHGWIITDDGIVDPTRWVFENSKPYIYEGPDSDEYDEGGNSFRKLTEKECPRYNPDKHLDVDFGEAKEFIRDLTGDGEICLDRLFWLSNLSLGTLGEFAKPIYEEIARINFSGFIPIDNRIAILEN